MLGAPHCKMRGLTWGSCLLTHHASLCTGWTSTGSCMSCRFKPYQNMEMSTAIAQQKALLEHDVAHFFQSVTSQTSHGPSKRISKCRGFDESSGPIHPRHMSFEIWPNQTVPKSGTNLQQRRTGFRVWFVLRKFGEPLFLWRYPQNYPFQEDVL